MKNLKVTQGCQVNGEHVEPGTILHDVSDAVASELISSRRAVPLEESEPGIINRDPEVVNQDPA